MTAVHTAKGIAKHAGISEVFVYTAMTPGPNPTPSGMFTYVPAPDELNSNVVGLDVYNEDKQNIGTIKDIALDASGLILLNKVAADGDENHLFGRIHTSAMGRLEWVCQDRT